MAQEKLFSSTDDRCIYTTVICPNVFIIETLEKDEIAATNAN